MRATAASIVCVVVVSLAGCVVASAKDDAELAIAQQEQQQQSLVERNQVAKTIVKKSVEDEQEIQAAEAYEFEYLPESSPDYETSEQMQQAVEPVASASHDDHHDHHDHHHHRRHHHHHHHHHHPKVGYSVGGPLVNIAQGAAQAAHTFEKNQPTAAAQAAYVAKNRLGQSAGLSAATAAAAFAGKQIILRGLEQQAYNAHRALESEKLQLQQAQRAATAAAHAAQQAMHQVQVITTALNAAQATSQHASQAAAEAAAELAAQTAMVGAAKARLQAIEDQLHHARIDFEATQAANFKAAHAAQVAQNNAAAAAAHAAEVANKAHHRHHHHHHGHGHQHHHHEHHSKLENESDDGNHDESIAVPVASAATKAAAADDPDKLSSDSELDKNSPQVSQQPTADYSGNLASLLDTNKDELYDSYDSYPY